MSAPGGAEENEAPSDADERRGRGWQSLVAGLFALGLAGFGVFTAAAGRVPPLTNRDEIRRSVTQFIELQRSASAAANPTPFQLSSREALPRGITAAALARIGCPDFDVYPKESGLPWTLRVVGMAAGQGFGTLGPGRCEAQLADRIASAIGVGDGLDRAIATDRIHAALDKDDLLAWELSIHWFSDGIFGVEAAGRRLFGGRPLLELTLAEQAELLVAESQWSQVTGCKVPERVEVARDDLLARLAALRLVEPQEVERAKREQVLCRKRRR